jgi:hypothetical protein
MIELDPKQDENHWRLGLAYYLAGDFAKSAEQFEKDFKFDDVDRENGLWHMLARAGIDGIGSASASDAPLHKAGSTRADECPLRSLRRVIKTDEFFRGLQQRGFMTNQQVMFYATALRRHLRGPEWQSTSRRRNSSAWRRIVSGAARLPVAPASCGRSPAS